MNRQNSEKRGIRELAQSAWDSARENLVAEIIAGLGPISGIAAAFFSWTPSPIRLTAILWIAVLSALALLVAEFDLATFKLSSRSSRQTRARAALSIAIPGTAIFCVGFFGYVAVELAWKYASTEEWATFLHLQIEPPVYSLIFVGLAVLIRGLFVFYWPKQKKPQDV